MSVSQSGWQSYRPVQLEFHQNAIDHKSIAFIVILVAPYTVDGIEDDLFVRIRHLQKMSNYRFHCKQILAFVIKI